MEMEGTDCVGTSFTFNGVSSPTIVQICEQYMKKVLCVIFLSEVALQDRHAALAVYRNLEGNTQK